MPYCFPRSSIKFQSPTVQNIIDFDPNWAFPDYRLVAAFKSLRFALLDKFCAINSMIFSGIRQSICELWCWWYCHMGGPFKSSQNIKWGSNGSWMKNSSEHPIVYHVYMMFLEGFWKVLGPTSLLKYLKFWVSRNWWGHSWHAALLAICGMLYDWFYYWLYLILAVLLNIKYLKSRVSVNTPCT